MDDKNIFDLFPKDEFQVNFIPRPDGDFDMDINITGRTREYLERIAETEGKTLAELVDERIISRIRPEKRP